MSRDEDNAISLSCPSFGFRFGTGTAQELGLGTFKVKDQGRILDLIRFIQGFPMTESLHRTVSL
jgi:hypothetical protein